MKSNTSANEELITWELPAGEYVLCCFEAESFPELINSAMGKAMNYLFGTWLANRGLTTQPFSVEKYHETTPEAAYMEIWVIPIPRSVTGYDP